MKPEELLGQTFACECGRTHRVDVREVAYAADATARVPAAAAQCSSGRRVNLVADARTHAVQGAAVEEALRGAAFTVHTQILADPPHGDPVCDDVTRQALESRLALPCDLLVAVGSGVVNDLCKWIAADHGVPYVVVATAASMNGYASENIAPAVRGVKRVLSGTVPRAVLADPAVIANAPYELTTAGLGDALAKPVSMTDWQINHLLFEEYYCPLCAQLIQDVEPLYLDAPGKIPQRDPATIRALFDALIYSGLSMTLAGTSFPSSGGEHLLSHVLDMTALRDGTDHDYHGRQVGVGVIFTSALYDRLLALERPTFQLCVEETDAAYWTTLAPVVEEEHAGKRERAAHAVTQLRRPGAWDRVREIIRAGARPACRIRDCLQAAGAAHRVADIGCTVDRFAQAAQRCHQIRARYTVVDLARACGILPAAIEDITMEWLT